MRQKLRVADSLMLAPILLIGGVGYWQQQRTQKDNQPTRIEVRSLEVLPPTPSDVARGFDTRVKLSLGYLGAQPRGWGVTDWQKFSLSRISQPTVVPSKISKQKIEVRDVENRFDARNAVYIGTYLMKLRAVSNDVPVVLSASFQSSELQKTPMGTALVMNIERALNWRVVVRQKGVKTSSLAPASHFNGLKLKSITLDDKRKGKSSWNFDIRVVCELIPPLVDERTVWSRISPMHGDIYLTDSKGQRFKGLTYSPVMRIINDKGEMGLSPKQVELSFYSWENFPKDTSDLTFHTKISVDDLWPLEIKVPIKDIPPFR